MHQYHIAQVIRRYQADMKPILVHEGLNETIVYLENEVFEKPVNHRLVTNNMSMTMNRVVDRRYMNLFAYLPWAFHEEPKDALLISYGMGNTASALTDIETLEHIDVVDISEEIVDFSDLVFKHKPKHPLADSRVKVTIEDGRFFLNSREKKYDIITGEPPPPKAKGVVNLYSQEYFQLMKSRLKPGGLVTYWLPLHSLELEDTKNIGKAFCNVFADCSLWRGVRDDWVLMGGKGFHKGPSKEHLQQVWSKSQARFELNNILLETPEAMIATLLGDAKQLEEFWGDALPLSDRYPRRLSIDFPLTVHSDLVEWSRTEKREKRLQESSWLRLFWPEEFFADEQSLNVQRLLQTLWGFNPAKKPRTTLHLIEQIQSHSKLEHLVARIMASDADVLRIVQSLQQEESDKDIEYHRAVDALTRRDYQKTIEHFVRYIKHGGTDTHVPYVMAYAACRQKNLNGEFELPEALLGHAVLKDKDFGIWLRNTVGSECVWPDM
jgi:spermidine synthase